MNGREAKRRRRECPHSRTVVPVSDELQAVLDQGRLDLIASSPEFWQDLMTRGDFPSSCGVCGEIFKPGDEVGVGGFPAVRELVALCHGCIVAMEAEGMRFEGPSGP